MLLCRFPQEAGSGFSNGFVGCGIVFWGEEEEEGWTKGFFAEEAGGGDALERGEALDSAPPPNPGGGGTPIPLTPAAVDVFVADGVESIPGFPHPGGGLVIPAAEETVVVVWVEAAVDGFPHPGGGLEIPPETTETDELVVVLLGGVPAFDVVILAVGFLVACCCCCLFGFALDGCVERLMVGFFLGATYELS